MHSSWKPQRKSAGSGTFSILKLFKYSVSNPFGFRVLFYNDSNGTTDNITLSGTTDNYNNIEISYKYQTNYGKTIKVNIEVNKSFTLHDTYILNNKIIEIFGAFTCSDNRINKIQGEFGYTENGNIHIDGQNYFSITKVLGYK